EDERWAPTESPLWNWDNFEYRVKLEEPKFKDGDEVVRKGFAGCSRPADIWHVGSLGMDGMNLGDFIKADDVLWYWEFIDKDGVLKRLGNVRQNRAMAEEMLNTDNQKASLRPILKLGFELP
uniref:hypothetical protein n=1 Tax=uncultured Campylobacter sp. TaxID=218934 RepID=UPI0026331F0A